MNQRAWLTRVEGSMLARTLLDIKLVGRVNCSEPPQVSAVACNAIGGLAKAKEALLDLAFPLLSMHSDSESWAYYCIG